VGSLPKRRLGDATSDGLGLATDAKFVATVVEELTEPLRRERWKKKVVSE
jgi:hypothetical protein